LGGNFLIITNVVVDAKSLIQIETQRMLKLPSKMPIFAEKNM